MKKGADGALFHALPEAYSEKAPIARNFA